MTPPPTRNEVKECLLDLLNGRRTREEVSDWAAPWVTQDFPEVDDPVVWEGLTDLLGADLMTLEGYLHSEQDFRNWLQKIDAAEARKE